MDKNKIENTAILNYAFLESMYNDGYFPNHLVDKGKEILLQLSSKIEHTSIGSLLELYELTHDATERFNDLQEEFEEAGSEIETAARDCIGTDFDFIVKSYGFDQADTEELIAPRDW